MKQKILRFIYKMELYEAKNIGIKVGTAAITINGGINKKVVDGLALGISGLISQGKNVTLVTSGAIVMGRIACSAKFTENETLAEKQRYATRGQPILMNYYIEAFSKYNTGIGQILLIEDDLDSQKRLTKLKSGIYELQKNKEVPVLNENDAIATEEITFGDNDLLAAQFAVSLKQDVLIKLGVYDGLLKNKEIVKIGDSFDIKDYDDLSNEAREGRGGLESTLKAAEIATKAGILYVVGNANTYLGMILSKEADSTVFYPKC